MTVQFKAVKSAGGGTSVVAHINGETYHADTRNPRFAEIMERLNALDESVVELFNLESSINDALSDLGLKVSVVNGVVQVEGRQAPRALSETIIRLFNEGNADFARFARFVEKLAANPSFRSRQQLYAFIEANGVTLASDGDMVLYKGVRADENGGFTSIHRGTAWVNGEQVNGYIPANVGDVVTMPRADISDDPNVACHVGLHCGAWQYASSFGGGNTITVKVNPAHVVCVPNDHSHQKIRVERYEIMGQQTAEHPWVTWERTSEDDEDYLDEYDDYYDEDEYDDETYGYRF